ncbi:MAG: hypothetical protein ACI9BD_000093 [Candidatus Marinamargulisbacteria bacterium]|jgi:hypothetical protein
MNRITVSGILATALGILGISLCCLPVAGIALSALGISVLFFHKTSWIFIYVGSVLIGLGFVLILLKKKKKAILHKKEGDLNATLTCPECGFSKEEAMPEDACLFFYECTNCNTRLKPLKGDCCVFCSYSEKVCPPKKSGNCC